MFIFGMVACLATIGLLCVILFTLAVYIFPLFLGTTAGLWALQSDAGAPGAIIVALIGTSMALCAFRTCSSEARPRWMRVSASAAFVLPATLVGFLAVNGIARLIVPSEVWQAAFSLAGALFVGATAFRRIGAFRPATHFGHAAMSSPGSR